MFKQLFTAGAILMSASFSVNAAQTANYGWEDGVGTVLGEFDAGQTMQYSNLATGAAYSGNNALLVEDLDTATSGTPQGYVAWITGLTDGDTVDASFWAFDTTTGVSPSLRIWAHYTDDINDVDSYAGSAGGNSTYSGAAANWEQLSHSWTFDSDGNSRDGLIIEVRFYDGSSATTGSGLVDDLVVSTSSDTASIILPATTAVPVPAAVWLFGSALMGLVGIRRRA